MLAKYQLVEFPATVVFTGTGSMNFDNPDPGKDIEVIVAIQSIALDVTIPPEISITGDLTWTRQVNLSGDIGGIGYRFSVFTTPILSTDSGPFSENLGLDLSFNHGLDQAFVEATAINQVVSDKLTTGQQLVLPGFSGHPVLVAFDPTLLMPIWNNVFYTNEFGPVINSFVAINGGRTATNASVNEQWASIIEFESTCGNF